MDSFERNVTLRRKRTKSITETMSEVESINSTLDGTNSSMPNISNDDEETQHLRQEIEKLQSELSSAHNEIKNLSLENSDLKKTIQDLMRKNETITKAAKQLSSKLGTPMKSTRLTTTPRCSSKSLKKRETIETPRIMALQKISSTEVASPDRIAQKSEQTDYALKQEKHKLCILSSNKTNKILTIAQDTFDNYQICHYMAPNCGTSKLISDIDVKLKKFTMNDYCLIFIGEEDFLQTYNYVDLTINIRETLLKIQHTNIILCAPTFKMNDYSTMFNWRIETFNSLLYLDAYTHHYAYLFDSNYYLSYDYTMFRNRGSLKNNGMANIFLNLSLMIKELVEFRKGDTYYPAERQEHGESPLLSYTNSDANELFFLQ